METFEEILQKLPFFEEELGKLREVLLSNLVMINEIPAPTFKEQARRDFLLTRFTEYELLNCSTDEKDNALAILPGEEGEKNILVVAHTDTVFSEEVDHTVTMHPSYATGPGVGDNSLGLAAVSTLPLILERLNIRLKSNLILMGSSRSLGEGDIEGLRFFLDNTRYPISAGVCVEGLKLGRLGYSSIGMLRGLLSYKIPEEYDWTRFGAGGVLVGMNELINNILKIPVPMKPRTTIVLGSMEAGSSFDKVATKASLRFEIRSESEEMVSQLEDHIDYLAAEMASKTGADVSFKILARRKPGGMGFSHPLATRGRSILKELGVKPRLSPSTSELSAFIDKRIPAVTVGLTNGDNLNEEDEIIELLPIQKGLSQLVALLVAIDRGYCS